MICYLSGRLVEAGPTRAVVEVGGVGVEVRIPTGTLRALPPPGEAVTLHTHLVVREDDVSLYGFASAAERELFRALQGVSGIGPRLALAILSGCTPDRFWEAVRRQDASLLAGIPGVGRKTIGRLLVELRDRVPAEAGAGEAVPPRVGVPAPAGPAQGPGAGGAAPSEQAREALMALGYSHREATEAVAAALAGVGGETGVDELITAALRWLGRQMADARP